MIIEIDTANTNMPLSLRERIAIKVLLLLFSFVAPVKYKHQSDKFLEEFWK